jgi:hypothetical protein
VQQPCPLALILPLHYSLQLWQVSRRSDASAGRGLRQAFVVMDLQPRPTRTGAVTIGYMRLVCRQGVDYLSELLYSPERVIQDAERHLRGIQFNSIVGTGLSGALAVPLLARHFGVSFAIVRKPEDRGRHSDSGIEGIVGSRWLMADDRIATGATCSRVRDQVSQLSLPDGATPQFVGLYLTKGGGAFWSPERITSPRQHPQP